MMNRTSNTTQKTARAKIKIPYIRNASWLVIISGIIVLGSDSGSPVDSGSAWCPMAEKDNNTMNHWKRIKCLISLWVLWPLMRHLSTLSDTFMISGQFCIDFQYLPHMENRKRTLASRLCVYISLSGSPSFRWAGNRFMSSCVNTTLKKPNFKRRHSPSKVVSGEIQ